MPEGDGAVAFEPQEFQSKLRRGGRTWAANFTIGADPEFPLWPILERARGNWDAGQSELFSDYQKKLKTHFFNAGAGDQESFRETLKNLSETLIEFNAQLLSCFEIGSRGPSELDGEYLKDSLRSATKKLLFDQEKINQFEEQYFAHVSKGIAGAFAEQVGEGLRSLDLKAFEKFFGKKATEKTWAKAIYKKRSSNAKKAIKLFVPAGFGFASRLLLGGGPLTFVAGIAVELAIETAFEYLTTGRDKDGKWRDLTKWIDERPSDIDQSKKIERHVETIMGSLYTSLVIYMGTGDQANLTKRFSVAVSRIQYIQNELKELTDNVISQMKTFENHVTSVMAEYQFGWASHGNATTFFNLFKDVQYIGQYRDDVFLKHMSTFILNALIQQNLSHFWGVLHGDHPDFPDLPPNQTAFYWSLVKILDNDNDLQSFLYLNRDEFIERFTSRVQFVEFTVKSREKRRDPEDRKRQWKYRRQFLLLPVDEETVPRFTRRRSHLHTEIRQDYFLEEWFAENWKNFASSVLPGDFDPTLETIDVDGIQDVPYMFSIPAITADHTSRKQRWLRRQLQLIKSWQPTNPWISRQVYEKKYFQGAAFVEHHLRWDQKVPVPNVTANVQLVYHPSELPQAEPQGISRLFAELKYYEVELNELYERVFDGEISWASRLRDKFRVRGGSTKVYVLDYMMFGQNRLLEGDYPPEVVDAYPADEEGFRYLGQNPHIGFTLNGPGVDGILALLALKRP